MNTIAYWFVYRMGECSVDVPKHFRSIQTVGCPLCPTVTHCGVQNEDPSFPSAEIHLPFAFKNAYPIYTFALSHINLYITAFSVEYVTWQTFSQNPVFYLLAFLQIALAAKPAGGVLMGRSAVMRDRRFTAPLQGRREGSSPASHNVAARQSDLPPHASRQ